MRVTVTSNLERLEADMAAICKRAPGDLNDVVREGIRVGNQVAKDYARQSSGDHGKLYPRSFTTSMSRPYHSIGASVYSGEYGPDPAYPQGGMSFEGGSRNQPPHRDLAKSADLIGPSFAQEVGRTVDGWFW